MKNRRDNRGYKKMMISYKYRIYPNKTQKEMLSKTFGCVRFLWNKNVEVFNNKGEFKSSTLYREEFDFLREVSAGALQQKEKDFKQFKDQFFSKDRKKKLGRPSFKSRRDKQSFRLPNQKFTLKDNKIRLEKIGWIRVKIDRTYSGREMSVTVTKDLTEKYYVSILVETEQIKKQKTGKQVGIDLGIKRLITTSDGLQIKNYSDNQGIKSIQRNLSRKKKGSRRYKELKLKLAKLHKKQSQKRDWLLHNISKYLVDNYDIIAMEDLSVEGLLKNKILADKISKSSWARLTNFVEYKSIMYGRDFYKINRYYPSSKKCCKCGKIKESLQLSDRVYICDCGNKIDRDLNASINIKTVGVHAVKQSVMDSTLPPKVRQAIPVELMNFL